jgi:UDP-glucose 4-epimerase
VIHFAASKAVGESVENPLLYYENNINALVYILQELQQKRSSKFYFSSSCTVYGQAETMPITENAHSNSHVSLWEYQTNGKRLSQTRPKSQYQRYFVALFQSIGSHPSAEIGELPLGVPQNLVPFITQTGFGLRKELAVYGDDYPTPDGTAIRDYIHVVDLAKAHVITLRLWIKKNTTKVETFNLGWEALF